MLGASLRAVARSGARSVAARSRPAAAGSRAGLVSPQVRGGHAARGRVDAVEAELAVGSFPHPCRGPRAEPSRLQAVAAVHLGVGDLLFTDDDDGT